MKSRMLKLSLFLALATLASAATIDFSFSGQQLTSQQTATGTGSLAFADGITTVGLPDLTAFFYSGTVVTSYFAAPGTTIQSFGLSNLADFALIITGASVSTFKLDTTPSVNLLQVFSVFPTSFGIYGNTGGDITGPITITGVDLAPEPVPVALIGLGLAGLGLWRKNRLSSSRALLRIKYFTPQSASVFPRFGGVC